MKKHITQVEYPVPIYAIHTMCRLLFAAPAAPMGMNTLATSLSSLRTESLCLALHCSSNQAHGMELIDGGTERKTGEVIKE